MPEPDELARLIIAGREGLGVEFKSSMSWDEPSTKGKVVKAVLAFANKRDGGVLVFGVERLPGATLHTIVGMSDRDYDSFDQDAIASKVNAHAAPYVDLSIEHRLIDGKRCVVIVVREFQDYPVLCTEDLVVDKRVIVGRGRIYCRSRRMPESAEVQSPDDIRDIIELGIAKGLERYFRLRRIEGRLAGPAAQDQFRAQLRDLEP